MKATFDITTPLVNHSKNASISLWLKIHQGWLWVGLVLKRKKEKVIYFNTNQQDLINDVPACLYWDAECFYKVTINNIDVTFDKSPILTSQNYSGSFTLTVYGLLSKSSKTISLHVKSYKQTRNIKAVKPEINILRSQKFLAIQNQLIKIRKPKIKTKKTSILLSDSKHTKLSIKPGKIIPNRFIENLKELSIYHNYQQDFIKEKNK